MSQFKARVAFAALAITAVATAAPRAQETLRQAIASKRVSVMGKPLRGDPAGIHSVRYSPDGKRILSAGDAGELRLWSATSGKLQKRIRAHEGSAHVALFYDNGSKIVSIGDDRTVAFFDAKSGKELTRVPELPEDFAEGHGYGSYAVTPDSSHLLIRDPRRNAKTMLRVDLQNRTMAEPIPLPGEMITRFTLSSDGRFLAMAERGKKFETYIHLYDLKEGKTVYRERAAYPNCMQFSPDGLKLFVLDFKSWAVHDGRSGERVSSFPSPLGTPRVAASTPDGSRLFVGSSIQGAVVGVDTSTTKNVFEWRNFATEVLGVALSPDQKTLAAGSLDGTLRLFDPESGKERKKAKGLQTRITAVALSPDGTRMITGTRDNEVALWDAARKKIVSRHREHESTITEVGFNASGQPWSVEEGKILKLHDTKTGKVTTSVDLRASDQNLMDVVMTRDGKQLIASHYVRTETSVTGKRLHWNLLTGELAKTVKADEVFNVIDISATGKTVGVQRDRLAFWQLNGTEPEFVCEPQESGYYGLALIDDDHAVTGNIDGELVIFKRGETKPHKKVAHEAGSSLAGILAAADGSRIFFCGTDAIVIYDRELSELARVTAYDGYPVSAALSSDGSRLICGMSDSTVLTWSLAKLLK